jgi:hypothetical protein
MGARCNFNSICQYFSFRLWRRVDLQMANNVEKEHTASTFWAEVRILLLYKKTDAVVPRKA